MIKESINPTAWLYAGTDAQPPGKSLWKEGWLKTLRSWSGVRRQRPDRLEFQRLREVCGRKDGLQPSGRGRAVGDNARTDLTFKR